MLDLLPTFVNVGIMSNMKAELLLKERHQISPRSFAELVIWRVPEPVRGSLHSLKYRLAFIVEGECVVRYDNEAGKGDHRHVGDREEPYSFTSPDDLLDAFWRDVDEWRLR